MRTTFAVYFVLLVAVALAPPLAAHDSPPVPAGQIAVEASFEKGGERPDQYLCTVTVKDLASGEILSAPKIQIQAGENATTSSATDEYEVSISAFVTKGGGQVDLAVIVKRGGVKTAAQATTIKLPL